MISPFRGTPQNGSIWVGGGVGFGKGLNVKVGRVINYSKGLYIEDHYYHY